MKLLSYLLLTAAATVPFASGRNCSNGLTYCGYNLNNIGDYTDYMKKAMQRRGYNGDHPEHVLFKCINGFGSIEMLYSCHGKCQDGGRGNDDHCADDADVLTSKPRQQTISTLSSARMHHLEQQKQDEKVEDAIAALQILEEALTEKKAKIEGYENPADALAIVAVALEL